MESSTDEESAVEDRRIERRRRWRRVRRVAYCVGGAAVGLPLIAFWIAYLLLDVRSPQAVLDSLSKTVPLRYADGGELLRVVPEDGDRRFVPYDKVPEKLRAAIVATEDPTFWDNAGFDPTGIGRALLTGVGGGSGITQQYIKKSTGDEDATLGRKLQELVLATKITQQQSKERIFESYVNIISFGRGTFGPAAGMNAFFGRPLDDTMTWSEAAFLAGMIQSPSVHDPAVSGDAHSAKRWAYVRDKLVERGYVHGAEAAAMTYPGADIRPPGQTRERLGYDEYHVKQQVLAELERDGFPLSRLQQGNLIVQTTLDRGAQAAARSTLHDRLRGEPKEFRGGLVSVDPVNGAVRAYDGGDNGVRDYAGTAHPLGSAFYPFTLAGALRTGTSPDERVPSPEKINFLGEDFAYPPGCPQSCTLRTAMSSGADTPYIALAKRLGPDAVSAAARDAGIPATMDGTPTLREKDGYLIGSGIAVGRYPLRPLDVAGAYATFAAGGMRTTPHLVDKILDQDGDVVWQHEDSRTPAFSPDEGTSRRIADQVTATLPATLPGGRAAALRTGEFQHGSSEDTQDAWAVGYTRRLATAVWIGSDDERRLFEADGRRLAGSDVPADIWRAFMSR
ncbi:transglycosylase domain-containing protein [Amycolatopsis jiangsuensis]|uniref:Membrane peptidoglycan carboxypeptidase n=1 Tax=Amycolatopsis jiangsuensis TaxID=1181879 RepID=A0A840IVQ3_9PSEU|nr:transglycosylase domain-containing protein [Amycolatopsis jiangsuensis]MBB4685417.1 membrane peptidoglycan carboxypeptidase [Amycolatopsis jiangsuensis]